MAKESENRFERRRDALTQAIQRRQEAASEAAGVGKRPYGHVRLKPSERRAYWETLTPQERMGKLQGMSPEEQDRLARELGV